MTVPLFPSFTQKIQNCAEEMLQEARQSRRLLRTELQNTTSANTGKIEPLFLRPISYKIFDGEREVDVQKISWMLTNLFYTVDRNCNRENGYRTNFELVLFFNSKNRNYPCNRNNNSSTNASCEYTVTLFGIPMQKFYGDLLLRFSGCADSRGQSRGGSGDDDGVRS